MGVDEQLSGYELKACPFCGNRRSQRLAVFEADENDPDDIERYAVECYRCNGSSGLADSVEDAIEKWNTRHEGPVQLPCPFCGYDKSYDQYCAKCAAVAPVVVDIYFETWNIRPIKGQEHINE